MFELHTERLLIRSPRPEDAQAIWAWRNDPRVSALQSWELPYPMETIRTRIAEQPTVPTAESWWTGIVEVAATGEAIGELVAQLTNGTRTAEVGYTLAHDAWGRGYAVEGLSALVAHLFETLPVTRVWGGLHPENRASAMVLERVGMLFEGHTQLSFWIGEDNSDDWIYGMTRPDWERWRDRPRHAPQDVRLVEITPANARNVRALSTHHTQRSFVAPVLDSFADALFPEVLDEVSLIPWLRAIEADGELVGFVMLARPDPVHADPYLWRLLIDRMHQRRGIASRALALVADQCREWGASALLTSWVEGKGTPAPFYRRLGFVPLGVKHDGEREARLDLT